MPINIVDVNTFTATVTTVADGEAGDQVEFAKAPQALANRTYYNKLKIEEAENLSARYTLSGTSLPLNGAIVPVLDFADTGFSISGTDVRCPANGTYLVSVSCLMQETTATSNPYLLGVKIQRNADQIVSQAVYRFSGNTAHTVTVSAAAIVQITNNATQGIRLLAGATVGSSTTITNLIGDENKMSIVLLARS